jgi:hypothetical protein
MFVAASRKYVKDTLAQTSALILRDRITQSSMQCYTHAVGRVERRTVHFSIPVDGKGCCVPGL